jgi:hypothetical protein
VDLGDEVPATRGMSAPTLPATLGERPRLPILLEPQEIEPVPPERRRRGRRRRLARGFRSVLILLVAAAIGAGGGLLFTLMRDGVGPRLEGAAGSPGPGAEQGVVSWTVWDEEREAAFIAVVTSGGDIEPIALGVPGYTMANIPGYGTAAVGDVAALVDAVGGIEVGSDALSGKEAVAYLERGNNDDVVSAELQFIRWQEVMGGILSAVDGRPETLVGLPREVAAVVAEAGKRGAEVLELPVEDIGSGLARPDAAALRAIVSQRFVPTSKVQGDVRLVVLNGEGTPGIGERVARVLVPSGFRLVSSLNAESFDVRETRIVASSREFLDAAEVARELLGVGKVFLDEQRSGVTDVTVIIGADFGGP